MIFQTLFWWIHTYHGQVCYPRSKRGSKFLDTISLNVPLPGIKGIERWYQIYSNKTLTLSNIYQGIQLKRLPRPRKCTRLDQNDMSLLFCHYLQWTILQTITSFTLATYNASTYLSTTTYTATTATIKSSVTSFTLTTYNATTYFAVTGTASTNIATATTIQSFITYFSLATYIATSYIATVCIATICIATTYGGLIGKVSSVLH